MSNNSLDDNGSIDWEAKYKRALADLQNKEKDFEQQTGYFIQFANLGLLKKIIPLYESVWAATKHDDGLAPIQKQFEALLEGVGVKRMKTLGQPFDPHYHEAIERREEEGRESHVILEEVSPGYLYHDQVLKPAKVIVST